MTGLVMVTVVVTVGVIVGVRLVLVAVMPMIISSVRPMTV